MAKKKTAHRTSPQDKEAEEADARKWRSKKRGRPDPIDPKKVPSGFILAPCMRCHGTGERFADRIENRNAILVFESKREYDPENKGPCDQCAGWGKIMRREQSRQPRP